MMNQGPEHRGANRGGGEDTMLKQCRKAAMAGLPALVFLVLMAACGKPAVVEPPRPVNVTIDVEATAAVNPDADGRPSPLAVRVFQLADSAVFMKSDLNGLWSDDAAVLAAALVSRQEFMIAPGASAQGSMTLDPRTRYVGVAAAFRDFRSATWRTVEPVSQPPVATTEFVLTVALDVTSVSARLRPAADAGAVQ
jgi:type VI secretion system protein VasD